MYVRYVYETVELTRFITALKMHGRKDGEVQLGVFFRGCSTRWQLRVGLEKRPAVAQQAQQGWWMHTLVMEVTRGRWWVSLEDESGPVHC